MPRSESQKQLDELAKQEEQDTARAKAFAGPAVADYGLVAGGDIGVKRSPAAKFEEMKSKFTTEEHRQYQRILGKRK